MPLKNSRESPFGRIFIDPFIGTIERFRTVFCLSLFIRLLFLSSVAHGLQNDALIITDYGTAGDGVTDDSRAFHRALDEIAEVGGRIVIPAGSYLIDDVTFPDDVTLAFRGGGTLVVSEGGKVRIDGAIEAGIVQIFSGKGSVTGRIDNLHVYPQWFGARGDGETDDAEALQRAADLAAGSMGNTLFIPDGDYLFRDDVVIRANVENRGLLVKKIEIDEERTQFSNFTFVPTHYPKNNPHISFEADHEELELAAEYFYGVEEGQLELPVYRDIPLADGSGKVDIAAGGTIRFYSSDFFSSRSNQKGDEFYDRNDVSQIVSGRGDVFPEFAFSYPEPPDVEAWSEEAVYGKGDYVTYGGKLFKATWPSGRGTVFEDRFLGTVDIGPVRPEPEETTTYLEFIFDDGSEDSIRTWRRVETRVWYRQKDRPLRVNGLRVEVRLEGHEGESKRISAGAVNVNRSNMTFDNLEITVREREATLARLLTSSQAVNLEFNNGYFSGATFHGLGYNILNSNVANVRYNDCISTNSRKGLDGRHGKNVTIRGGFFNVINDHYGRNYVIRDVVMSGQSTDVPGYVTPDADLQAWHFRSIPPFGFSGANFHIENVTINEASGILSVRGDIGDLYGTIVLSDIIVRRNDGDVTVVNHAIDSDFDFAGEVRAPDRMIIEDVGLENSGRLNLNIGRGFETGTYGPVFVRNTGPVGEVYTSSSSLSFSDCTVADAEFEVAAGAQVNFRNCTFSGSSAGLTEADIGAATGNVKARGASVSFPIDYLNRAVRED